MFKPDDCIERPIIERRITVFCQARSLLQNALEVKYRNGYRRLVSMLFCGCEKLGGIVLPSSLISMG